MLYIDVMHPDLGTLDTLYRKLLMPLLIKLDTFAAIKTHTNTLGHAVA
jgi:hypothetical protein